MSFFETQEQVLSQKKTVTRRQGWKNLKVGDLIQPIEKGMGLKRGEKQKLVGGLIRVVKVSREPINAITQGDCAREGFPQMSPEGFVDFYCGFNKCKPTELCTRIEFEYLEN